MNNYTPIVLYLCIDSTLGGSTQSLLDLIKSIRGKITPIVIVTSSGMAYNAFVKEGIECYIYPFNKLYTLKKNRLIDTIRQPWRWHYIRKLRFDYGCLRFVKKHLRGRKVDIVHSNTSPNDIGVLLSKRLQAKHIWHIREFCDLDFQFDIYKGLPHLRGLINNADGRIAISTAMKTHWQLKEYNTWVINDAIRSKDDICYNKNKDKYFLFCSYCLTESKGTRIALLAFAQSRLASDGYKLKLMGNCNEEYKKSLMITIAENKLEDSVDFVNCQKDVKPFFINATTFIMASECEGLGRVTAEAMFYGCPVVARASGGTLDLVKHGITGYLYNTIEECAILLRRVCVEDQEHIIRKAQEFVMNNLSQECYGPKIINVYKNILNS